ncbi:aspartate carbamoyltransferase [Streptomyces litchfieldiae]|uniref:Aspartate carbamoyltransferase n=1 Tax=Streptomyces litchfieldiae TaxID=3075543 RepID=A0ABU2MR66_9ACTN|nr:aspartate carbamoyltransferase [Streptomyces sp. DSM 44938]MDT0344010.1 aspartate carbamoyltransferase [Streptomyces sp. DSM 44938]
MSWWRHWTNSGKRRVLLASASASAGAALAAAAATVALAAAAATVALMTGGPARDAGDGQGQSDGQGQGDRQPEVAERGREVMPFDLEETTHHFTPTPTGGVQDVVANRPGDAGQIDLIRAHLREEAAAFGRGDFGDPARIHGPDMPGLAELEAGHDQFEVRYEERTDGATLFYETEDPALVDALHDWFEAQLSDHGSHAGSGH